MNRKTKANIMKIALYTALLMYAFITIFPFLWAISASFKPYQEITGGGLNLIPKTFTWNAYQYLFQIDENFNRWIVNSFINGRICTCEIAFSWKK